ncbi:hypothetical protein [Chitinibacter tainanensis]|uniref:hypothetical protein n=1 Tax=Chitinibacter tainanensis TaxID=230667 RepID=UPI0012EC7101|nr:hypothetical protein [Chitinibacter tainanensis]
MSVLLAIFVGVNSHAFALSDYRCVIERVHGADPDADPVLSFARKITLGKEFTVDRNTGIMAGALKNAYQTRPVVIDQGSKENGFKAVTTMRAEQGIGRSSAIYTLQINEHAESPTKPFVFLTNDIVYFGRCTHY